MAAYDVLKEIVTNGSNLMLFKSINYDVMRELMQIAKRTGAKVTFPTSMSHDVIRELSSFGGNNVTFMDGLENISLEEIVKEIRRLKD